MIVRVALIGFAGTLAVCSGLAPIIWVLGAAIVVSAIAAYLYQRRARRG